MRNLCTSNQKGLDFCERAGAHDSWRLASSHSRSRTYSPRPVNGRCEGWTLFQVGDQGWVEFKPFLVPTRSLAAGLAMIHAVTSLFSFMVLFGLPGSIIFTHRRANA
jgi:hypothetical protein